MSDHDDDASDINNDNTQPQQQQNIQPQIITTVSNNNAKFPYLKKDEYEVWAMKMEYWITNNDMNIWKVIQNGNSLKRTGRDRDGRVIILPPTTADEHIAVQRESKARTTLLQSIPDDHVADFHYMDDARDIWNAVKARFGGNAESKKMRKSMLKQEFSEFRISESEGLHKGYDRMQKILSQLNQLKAKPDDEDINLKFLRGLPSSWSQVALTLKTKGGLELLSFDDLYYKLKTLEIDIKGYSTHSSSQSPSHSAFVSTTSTSKKMSYAESPSFSSSTTYSAPSSSKARSHSSGNVLQDVLHSLVAESEPEQQVAYEDFEQIDKLDLEEMDIKWQMAMLSVRVNKFEKKAGRKIEFDKKEAARFNKKAVRCYKCLQKGHFARECRAKGGNEKRYSSFKIQELGKKEADTKALITVDTLENWKEHESGDDEGFAPKEYGMVAGCGAACEEGAAEVYSLITGNGTDAAAGEFALMGMTSEKNKRESISLPDAGDEGIVDSGCSRSMTGNKERLDDFQSFKGGKVTFGGGEGRITEKGQSGLLISQICDKKNRVLFTDTDCLVLSNDFKLPDESMVLLRVPRKHNLYTFNLNNLAPKENLACLVAKASSDEAVKWHRRIGHVNYKNMNKLVKDNLVRGLPPKAFSKMTKLVLHVAKASNTKPPIRFCWVFFLETKDETYPILKDFISLVENQLNKKVKAIRCDNGTEFKNANLIELCGEKGIKRDYSNARTPQQNGVAERKNRTLIEAARTIDHLGKFDGKADEGYLVGYPASNRAYRDDDSDSNSDEQVILVPSYPSNNIPGAETKDTSDAHSNDVLFDTAEDIFQQELARLKDQEQRATSDAERLRLGFAKDAEELQKRASAKKFLLVAY
ncbi:putative ribonuclease H-like domain-containing protein [Tanacetum coccineum]